MNSKENLTHSQDLLTDYKDLIIVAQDLKQKVMKGCGKQAVGTKGKWGKCGSDDVGLCKNCFDTIKNLNEILK